MKTTRQMAAFFLAVAAALSLAACSGETTLVMRGDITGEMSGIPAADTWTLTAKGDVVQTVHRVFEFDLFAYEEEERDSFIAMLDIFILGPAQNIEGVVCASRTEDTAYIIELTVDCTGSAVSEAAAAGILSVDGNSDKISLRQTRAALERQGYEAVR